MSRTLRPAARRRSPPHVGILVAPGKGEPPFGSAVFLRRLAAAGEALGLQVCVFALDWIDWPRERVQGYRFDEAGKTWIAGEFALPRIVYDRAFHRNKEQARRHREGVARLSAQPGVELLGRGVGGKLEVYRRLCDVPELKELLPPSVPYAGPASLVRALKAHGDVVLKPQGGMQGRRVFRIRRLAAAPNEAHRFEARGRAGASRLLVRRFARAADLLDWVDKELARGKPFLIQPYLPLTTTQGEPFDIRALVQKDGSGQWSFTGAAARIGPAGGVASNLHGGGRASPASELLSATFGDVRAKGILERIRRAAMAVPPAIEAGFGPQLELGIDFGVDRTGRVWVLEVNSKPGRTSFMRLNDMNARIAAVMSPIRYARYVLDRRLGGQHL